MAILLGTDFRNTKGLTQQQLEGQNAALLCSVALPKEIRVNPNRDCDRLPQELVNRRVFDSIKYAVEFVDVVRQKNWGRCIMEI